MFRVPFHLHTEIIHSFPFISLCDFNVHSLGGQYSFISSQQRELSPQSRFSCMFAEPTRTRWYVQHVHGDTCNNTYMVIRAATRTWWGSTCLFMPCLQLQNGDQFLVVTSVEEPCFSCYCESMKQPSLSRLSVWSLTKLLPGLLVVLCLHFTCVCKHTTIMNVFCLN